MKIVIILGSVREGRQSNKVSNELAKIFLTKTKASIEILDLASYNLPLMTEKISKMPQAPEALLTFADKVNQADALIFVSPEYNGTYTGVFKNAIDYLFKEFHRKPIGVVSVASGKMGGINCSLQLQHLVLSLGAYPMPLKLLVPFVQNAFDADENLIEEGLIKSFDAFTNEFLWFAEAIVKHKQTTA